MDKNKPLDLNEGICSPFVGASERLENIGKLRETPVLRLLRTANRNIVLRLG